MPDHPWVTEGAAVRIAMTVAEPAGELGTAGTVARVEREDEEHAEVVERGTSVIHSDLRAGANVAGAVRLKANVGLSFQGMNLVGEGFRLSPEEVTAYGYDLAALPPVVRPYKNARDVTQGGPPRYVIDFYGLTAEQAAELYPRLYQHVLVNVKPERDQNNRDSRRRNWWLFGEPVGKLRHAAQALPRIILTPKTAAHRIFISESTVLLPDCKNYVVCIADSLALGILSSSAHVTWATAAGGWLGVGNDSTYNNKDCFDPFPFPTPTESQAAQIRDLGERLDAHRKARQAAHPELTLTGMYNVLAKLRANEPLNDKERAIHERGLVSILREIHDALDDAVLDAYGWPRDLDDEGILERLVALNRERAEEEKRGLVRWLRPDYQRALAGEPEPEPEALPLPGLDAGAGTPGAGPSEPTKWPATLSDRIAAVRAVIDGSADAHEAESVARRFKAARRADVSDILDSLAAL
ncbi:MAG: class I SAM-dependent DNA methyltransferase, partial [Deltaproteobacteria bacterium]|nr:class I SAM-dependent DNA methyltransferase [Deltaproteobacteria bacterium]